tara:strand:- start:146 stop:619 length:474 start_codon:yes stop_codon:yes gene_type:complete
MEREPITSVGAQYLRDELKKCMEERPKVIDAIATARDFGDLAENAEYHAARERQSWLEGRIQELNGRLEISYVVDLANISTDKIKFGTNVKLVDIDTNEEVTYAIVSEVETNPSRGWISYKCPLGKALLGKQIDDIVDFEHGDTYKEYEVCDIQKIE